LQARGIGCRGYYRRPVHRQPAMERFAGSAELPGTEAAASRGLAIPMSPVLGDEQAQSVADAVREALAAI
jgi:dTDP-3-amino-3,4,6-trideoxy-alpha-D-glucose transaminase